MTRPLSSEKMPEIQVSTDAPVRRVLSEAEKLPWRGKSAGKSGFSCGGLVSVLLHACLFAGIFLVSGWPAVREDVVLPIALVSAGMASSGSGTAPGGQGESGASSGEGAAVPPSAAVSADGVSPEAEAEKTGSAARAEDASVPAKQAGDAEAPAEKNAGAGTKPEKEEPAAAEPAVEKTLLRRRRKNRGMSGLILYPGPQYPGMRSAPWKRSGQRRRSGQGEKAPETSAAEQRRRKTPRFQNPGSGTPRPRRKSGFPRVPFQPRPGRRNQRAQAGRFRHPRVQEMAAPGTELAAEARPEMGYRKLRAEGKAYSRWGSSTLPRPLSGRCVRSIRLRRSGAALKAV